MVESSVGILHGDPTDPGLMTIIHQYLPPASSFDYECGDLILITGTAKIFMKDEEPCLEIQSNFSNHLLPENASALLAPEDQCSVIFHFIGQAIQVSETECKFLIKVVSYDSKVSFYLMAILPPLSLISNP